MRTPNKSAMDKVYDKLPAIHCQRKCQASCGPILMSRLEWQRIKRKMGYRPKAKSLLEVCPMLNQNSGSCRVYSIRPMICRLWGLVEKMACPWGCEPERWVTDKEAAELLHEIETLAGQR